MLAGEPSGSSTTVTDDMSFQCHFLLIWGKHREPDTWKL